MGSNSTEKSVSKKEILEYAENLKDIFKDAKKKQKYLSLLVERLENADEVKALYPNNFEQFYKIYTIELIKYYVTDRDRQEILLVALRLLQGYEFITRVGKRREEYAKKAYGYNDEIKYWGEPNDSLFIIEKEIINGPEGQDEKGLAYKLSERALKNTDKLLNFADKVIDKINNELKGDLMKYVLPTPIYLQKEEETLGEIENIPEQEANPDIQNIDDDMNNIEVYSRNEVDIDDGSYNEKKEFVKSPEKNESETLDTENSEGDCYCNGNDDNGIKVHEDISENVKTKNEPQMASDRKTEEPVPKKKSKKRKFIINSFIYVNLHLGHIFKKNGTITKKSIFNKRKIVIGFCLIGIIIVLGWLIVCDKTRLSKIIPLLGTKENFDYVNGEKDDEVNEDALPNNLNELPNDFSTGSGELSDDSAMKSKPTEDGMAVTFKGDYIESWAYDSKNDELTVYLKKRNQPD